tara:strand:+ start:8378 stop:9508 length:1131 start_codon:yes stop_codon:yes gene_type:complete
MQKDSLVFVTTGLGSGGAEQVLYNIIKKANKDHRILVISIIGDGYFKDKIKELGVEVLLLNFNKNFFFKLGFFITIFRLIKAIFKIRNSTSPIIYGWMPHGAIMSYCLNLFCKNTTLIYAMRDSLDINYEPKKLIIGLMKYLAQKAHVITFNSKNGQEQYNAVGISNKNERFIPNGYNKDNFIITNKENFKKEIFNKFNLNKNQVLIGFLARAHPMKGLDILIKSANIILQNNPNIVFLICGNNNFSSYKKFISPNHYNNFIFTGFIEDTRKIISSFDILVSSSKYGEGFSNSIAEAMMMEVICVATDVGDSAYILGNTGQLVNPNSVRDLTSGIESILKLKGAQRKEMQKNCRKRIIENFPEEKMIDQFLELKNI